MKLHLSNLDELIQKVRNVHSKNYLNESISSYRAGAYRASLITTWIAVCVDIIEKIRELSLSEDAAAKMIEERLDGINANDPNSMLSFEKDILDIACDELQLISTIEKSHLERLKNDRNVCAHPTFSHDGSQFSPHAELTLSYIVQASNYLLIHPPVKGKIVIQRLFEHINEPSFPEDEEKAFTLLSSDNNLGRVRESSVRNLTVILLKRVFRDESSISPELLNRISASLGAISRLYPETYTNVIETKLGAMLSEANDTQLKRVFPFLLSRNELWEKIATPEKIRIDGLMQSMDVDDLIKYQTPKLAEVNLQIRKELMVKIESFNNVDQAKLIASNPSQTFKNQAINIFIESLSFDSAEFRGNSLLVPMASKLDENDIKIIFRGAIENTGSYGINQILNAGSIELFFSRLYTETKSAEIAHSRLWLEFWNSLNEKGFSYESLRELLLQDELIQDEPKENDDDIPF